MQRKARSRASSFSEDDGGSSRSPTPPGGRAVRRKRSSSFSDNHMPTRRRSASFSEVVGSAFNTTAALFRRNTRSFFYHDSIESEDEDNAAVLHRALPTVTSSMLSASTPEWAGHPGRLVKNSTSSFVAGVAHGAWWPRLQGGLTQSLQLHAEELPTWQLWAKPLLGGAVALLVLNVADEPLAAGSSPSP